jgi:superoxide reductase
MVLQEENTFSAAKEKHVPVIEKITGGVLVKVGSVEHPMIETHYIE